MKPEQKEASRTSFFAEIQLILAGEEDACHRCGQACSVRPAILGPWRAGGELQILSGS